MSNLNQDLFSPSLQTRLQATLDLPRDIKLAETSWPAGCRGASNAFLVLIGPSYGQASPGESQPDPSQPRPRNSPTWVGNTLFDSKGDKLFPDNHEREGRWCRLMESALPEAQKHDAVRRLTALWNLHWSYASKEKSLSVFDLVQGAHDIFPLISGTKPRIIIALSEIVAQILASFIVARGYKHRALSNATNCKIPPLTTKFPDVPHETLVLKSPSHPSRRTLSDIQFNQLRDLALTYQ